MEKINIPMGGMSFIPDDNYSKDGDFQLLVNLRNEGGELVTMKMPSKRLNPKSVIMAKYHAKSGKWLELTNEGLRYENGMVAENWNNGVYFSFELIGNIVVLYVKDKNGVVAEPEYAIWRGGRYVYLGKKPKAPMMKAKHLEEKSIKKTTTEQYYHNKYVPAEHDLYYRVVQKGFVDEVLSNIYEEKGYIDRAWFRVGLRLFDGSYIALSGIYQLASRRTGQDDTIGNWMPLGLWKTVGDAADKNYHTAEVKYFVPTIEVNKIESSWRDIVVGIDVFSTGSIMSFAAKKKTDVKQEGENNQKLTTKSYEWYEARTADELKEAMINAEYYKVAEFSIDGKLLWEVENTSPSMIAVQKRLSEVQLGDVVPKKSTIINSRLHAQGVDNILFEGFQPAYMYDNVTSGGRSEEYTIVVYIDTWEGEKKVAYKETSDREPLPMMLNYFFYPDSRAKKLEVYKENDDGGGFLILSLPLTAHNTRNEAYFLKVDYENGLVPDVKTDLEWEYLEAIPNVDNIQEQRDVLKVSEVDNPFYFPPAQTYKFDADIIGVASNAESISQGQFGKFPLFVFTKSGIWAMATGDNGEYLSQSPFSREVCEGAICPVSGGVVFTTINGVRIISGGQIMDISRSIDNDNAVMIYTYSKGLYDDITKLANSDWKIYPVGVRNYINGANTAYKAMLAYNYIRNEIILSNKNYKYSYVYNLNTQSWSVVDYVFDVVTNSYPTLVVYDDNMRMTFDESTAGGNIAAISRPMKYGSLGYKRLRQAALRGTFECFGVLGFYILGSNDGVTFRCLTGKEYKEEETNRDLVTEMARSKQYKYLAYAIAGKANGRFSMVEMLLDGDFANSKLR